MSHGQVTTLPKRPLGRTGLEVSVLGFGASPLGNVFGNVDENECIQAVHEAVKLGINFIDVSPYYGLTLAETVLGKALKGLPRDKFILSTKVGRYGESKFDFSAERVTRSVDESLQRLQVPYIDIIQCHDIEFGSIDQIVNETLPALAKLKESGKVKFVGITGYPTAIFKKVLDKTPHGVVDVVLSYCHYALNDVTLEEILPYLKQKGVGIINASPLSMGLLTDRGPTSWHPAPEPLKVACKLAAEHCRLKNKNISELALQFSLGHSDISTTLVGMYSRAQVHENINAVLKMVNEGLDKELLSQVEAILEPVKNTTWPSGTLENCS